MASAEAQRQYLDRKRLASGLPLLQCQVCERHFRQLEFHLKAMHGLTWREYRQQYLKIGDKPTAPDLVERKRALAISNDNARSILDPAVMALSRVAVFSEESIRKMSETRRGRKYASKKSETALERRTRIEKTCANCAKLFLVWRSKAGALYCSMSCRDEYKMEPARC